MKKVLVGLMVAGLLLLGTSAFAAEVPTPEVQVPEISLEIAATDVKTAIEMRPVSLVEYFDFSIDFIATLMAKIAKTAQPVYLFNGFAAVQVALYENPNFDVVWGLSQEGVQYGGVEIKGLPLKGVVWGIFEKVHPVIAYYMGDEGQITLGVCYEFRAEE